MASGGGGGGGGGGRGGVNVRLIRVEDCSLNMESRHNFVI
jgi:hypothetical protein